MNELKIISANDQTLPTIAGEVLGFTIKPVKSRTFECRHCGQSHRYYNTDVEKWTVTCPHVNCGKTHQLESSDFTSHVPFIVSLTPTNAFKWRDWAVEKYGPRMYRDEMSNVAMAQTKTEPQTSHLQRQYGASWFSVYAKPIHYIKAACLCAEKGV